MTNFRILTGAVLAAATGVTAAVSALAASTSNPVTDAHIYTTYKLSGAAGIAWNTCGTTKETSGCYSSGVITPAAGVCAMLEGAPVTTDDVVKQKIFILSAGTTQFPKATLQVWVKTNTFTYKAVKTKITLKKNLNLNMNIAPDAACYFAGNAAYILAGSDISTYAIRINKIGWASSAVGGTVPVSTISGINGTSDGYITLSFGSGETAAFYVFGPNGGGSDGGGLEFIPDSLNSFRPQ